MNQAAFGWKSYEGAEATLAGIERWPMIKKGQLNNPENLSSWEPFYALAAYIMSWKAAYLYFSITFRRSPNMALLTHCF